MYDEETGKVTRVPLPKLTKREAELLENVKIPKKFLERIMKMNLRTTMSYQEDALRTESTVFNMEEGDERLLHAGIGLATESGEFLDALKKHVFYGKALDRTNLKEEVGDLLWYCAIALDELGSSFEEVQATNIAKLKARYPNKFTMGDAENRDLKAERKILED